MLFFCSWVAAPRRMDSMIIYDLAIALNFAKPPNDIPIHLLSCGGAARFDRHGRTSSRSACGKLGRDPIRFCGSSLRRVWLSGRLRKLLDLAATNGTLRRVFIWGSLSTENRAEKDLHILLIGDESFEEEELPAGEKAVFDSVRAKL